MSIKRSPDMSPESKGEMNQDATEEELKNVNEETTGEPCQLSTTRNFVF